MKLQEGEKVIHSLKPENGLLSYWLLSICLPLAIAGGWFSYMITWLSLDSMDANIEARMAAVYVAFASAPVFYYGMRFYCRKLVATLDYRITNQRCVYNGGVITRITRSVPLYKITDTQISQNIIESAIGISKLQVFTAGAGGLRAEITFMGLKDSETPLITLNELMQESRTSDET